MRQVDDHEETKGGRVSGRSPGSSSPRVTVRKESNSQGKEAGKATRARRLRKWLFGTRLRKFVTGIITLVIAPAVATIIAAYVPQIWSNPSTSESATPTQVIFYEPWDTADINKITLGNVRIDRTVGGYCWVSSIVTMRSDAYRCMYSTQGYIIDPCFAYPFLPSSEVREVVCPLPDPNSVTILRLTKPLPATSGRKAIFPTEYWYIILTNGIKCYAAGGTTDSIGGVESGSYYYCPGYGFPLFGYPNSSNSIWTILEQVKGVVGLEPAAIATAYH